MALNHDQDLPVELLEKLETLKIELEDGDITQKGYDKKRATLLEKHTQQKKEEEDALLASLGPEPSAADVVDFLDYLPSPTHSPPRPTSGANYMEQHHQEQHQQQEPSVISTTTRTSSITNHNLQNRYPVTTDPYQQQPPQPHSQYQYQQQQPIYSQQQAQQPPVGYPGENAAIPPSGQYYASATPASSASPRPSRPPYDPRMIRPQYAPQPQQYYPSPSQPIPAANSAPRPMYPQQQQQQQRPMPFPGSSYQSQPPRPMYSNQPRPMYRPNGSSLMINGNGGMVRPMSNGGGSGGGSSGDSAYYRPSAPTPQAYPPPGYPMQGRSPTLDQQRVPYGYNGGGISRSSTQNSSQGRYS